MHLGDAMVANTIYREYDAVFDAELEACGLDLRDNLTPAFFWANPKECT